MIKVTAKGRRGLIAAAATFAAMTVPVSAQAQVADDEIHTFFLADRLEYQSNEGKDLLVWEGDAWIGGDINKAWFKSEGEYVFEESRFEEAEVQALYSRAITSYFDFQAGVRYDFEPDPSRVYGVVGILGLAPNWFELDTAAFVSDEGDVSARVEAEYEFLLTQRLIAEPRAELNFAVQDVEELGIGSGLSTVELGLRVRYEVMREIAPYVGVSWSRAVGETADFRREDGEQADTVSVVAGIRLWY